MNPLLKLFLYPVVTIVIIMLVTGCNWLLTAFFALIFDVKMVEVVNSPFVFFYVLSGFGTLYLIVDSFCYIENQL